jgi:hypothetical protein
MKKIITIIGALIFSAGTAVAQTIITESTSNSTTRSDSRSETTVNSPPPSAIAPGINSMNSDLCTVGVSGAVQTQILGISGGATVRDLNCERLKLSKTLFDMGMKVAAVATLCQDERVFAAMMNAGTPCPVDGKIGIEAQEIWANNPDRQPQAEEKATRRNDTLKGMGIGAGLLGLLLLAL